MNTTATSARICACCKRDLSSENFYYITVHEYLTNIARSAARSGAGNIGKNAGIPKKIGNGLLLLKQTIPFYAWNLSYVHWERYALVSCGSGKRYRNPNTATSAITMYLFKNRNRFNGFVNMVHKNKTYDLPLHCHQA